MTLSMSPLQAKQPSMELSAAVVDKVTCHLPLQGTHGMQELPHLQELKLADPTFHQPGRIDLLLRGDILPRIMLPETRTGPVNMPIAWNTVFEWAILGPFKTSSEKPSPTSASINHSIIAPSDQLLSRFWEIEEPQAARLPSLQKRSTYKSIINSITNTILSPTGTLSPCLGSLEYLPWEKVVLRLYSATMQMRKPSSSEELGPSSRQWCRST